MNYEVNVSPPREKLKNIVINIALKGKRSSFVVNYICWFLTSFQLQSISVTQIMNYF